MNNELVRKIKTYLTEKPNRSYRNLKPNSFINAFGSENFKLILDSTNFLDSSETFSLRVRCFVDGMIEYPKCDTCGKNTKFDGSKWGKTCSKKCNLLSPIRLKKTAETNLNKYGSTEYFASSDSRKKIEETNIKKYNSKIYLNSDTHKELMVDYDLYTISLESRKNYYESLKTHITPTFDYEDDFPNLDKIYSWECNDCGFFYNSNMKNYNHLFCPECGSDKTESAILEKDDFIKEDILEFINNEYDGSYRFLKYKMFIENLGVGSYIRILEKTNKIPRNEYPFSTIVRSFVDDIFEIPKCSLETCNNFVVFNTNYGWQKYCSSLCNANSEYRLNKMCGFNNYFSNPNNISRIKDYNIKKYGVENYTQTEEYRNRLRTGDIKRNPNPEKVSLSRMTNHYNNIDSKFKKIRKLFSFEEYRMHGSKSYHRYKWSCNVCEHEFEWWMNMGCEPICPKCKPKGTKHEILIKSLLDNYKIPHIFRDRKVLGNGQEIDIYIPSKKLGIEINGLYYHTDQRVPKTYHYEKTELMRNSGNDLIHIFGDELLRKEKIVINKLKYKLGLIKKNIGARKCEIREIDNKTKTKFLNKYHIQGDTNASIKLGLFYKNRLVSVMTFGEPRSGIGSNKNPDHSYELIRFCTVFNFNINGAASKLISYFKNNYNWFKIYSYADRRWSNGDVYEKTGFKLTASRKYNYWYTKNHTERLHRSGFRKEERRIKLENHNPDLSELEDMKNNGYDVVWDCGTLTYTILNPNFK